MFMFYCLNNYILFLFMRNRVLLGSQRMPNHLRPVIDLQPTLVLLLSILLY